ncbi:probable bacteriophge tail fiber protein [Chromobacterium violaceum ATCC 12472]|nr:probable bacteriophge tail fiber protein [Chromobacterium violaceum ATCC 12472]
MWGGATYEQRLENGNWQPWVKLLKTGQQSTLADYGITDGASKTDLQTAVNNLVAGAPGALNTLQELAAALGNDQNFAATITNQLAGKASKATTLAGYGIGDAQTKTQSDARYFQRIARFTSNGQFTVPDGVTRIYVSGCGGGGGGGGSGASSASVMAAGGGGGAGNNVMRQDYPVRPGQVLNIVIGGGGSGGLGGPKNGATGSAGISGTNGGTTAIAEIGLSLAGGNGGGAGNTNGIWANGASPGNGGPGMAPGTIGWSGPTTNMCYPGGLGGNSPFGGGGSTVGWYWAGGVSQTGAGFGSGGGGGFAGSDGGGIAGANGAPGVIFIEW